MNYECKTSSTDPGMKQACPSPGLRYRTTPGPVYVISKMGTATVLALFGGEV